MTNNSLAASQRPNISLIDRRLSGARRVPYRVRFNVKSMLGKKQEASLPLDRDKPYQRSRPPAREPDERTGDDARRASGWGVLLNTKLNPFMLIAPL